MPPPTPTLPDPRIPLPALLLGAGGLVPFAALAIGIALFPEPNLSYFLGWLTQYGALIVTFVGALQWGLVMRQPDAGATDQWMAFGWSVCPSLVAWVALQLPQYEGVYLLAALFILCLIMDWRFAQRHALPRWFLRLRVGLTVGAVLSLSIAGLVLAGHGSHH
jgi:hypothetical protein